MFPVAWGAPLVVWQGVFYLAPFLFMLVLTFWIVQNFRLTPDATLENWAKILATGYFWDAYGRSLLGAGIAALAGSVLAFPCAYVLGLKVSPQARLLGACLLITPFFTSYLVRAFTWRTMLGDNGVINVALGYVGLGPFQMIDNLFGTVVGYLTLVFPLILVLQLLSLSFVDRRLIEAAHNLGCGGLRVVLVVVVPAARVGLVLAAAFAFVLSFGDFVSPQTLGGSNPPTLSLLVVEQIRGAFHWPRASVIAVVMVATLLSVIAASMALAYRSGGGRR
ncbi:MAG: ABC transporter permease [Gammaproteobacteria bacterium]|nr:ABC transporter permease [Gammaproteobacteria bacterium]NIR85068.1 ABC transporter permease [Gammaproteobacteria bacterium]NIR88335.1 ABC transporter permease [Gammaproteobacteria bacterium]NIU06115.1 ABC transporter permease [Gammaproteobacteria bacterium]NIV73534.1 ABC transporter permease [Gammaproteobacteria bacterium]